MEKIKTNLCDIAQQAITLFNGAFEVERPLSCKFILILKRGFKLKLPKRGEATPHLASRRVPTFADHKVSFNLEHSTALQIQANLPK